MTMPQVPLQSPGVGMPAAPQQVPPQQQFQVPPTQVIMGEPQGGFSQQAAWAMAAPPVPQQPQQVQQPQFAPPLGQQPQYAQPQQPQQPQFQQPQAQPQAPQPQQSQQNFANLNALVPPNAGFPPALVGQPVGLALQVMQHAIRSMQAQPQQQVPQQQTPQGQPQLPSQGMLPPRPQPMFQGQQPQGQPLTAEVVQQIVDASVNRAVQQVTLPNNMQQAAATIQNLPYANNQQVLGSMQQKMAGLPQEAWANPAVWQSAYHMAVGELASAGQLPPAQQRQQVPQQQGWQPPQQQPGFNQLNGPQAWQPYPQTGQIFTEQPNGGQPVMNAQQLTPQMQAVAAKFKMPLEQYAMWSGGQVPQQQPGGTNGF